MYNHTTSQKNRPVTDENREVPVKTREAQAEVETVQAEELNPWDIIDPEGRISTSDGRGDEPGRRPDYGVIDRNTGEMQQLSLLGAQWEEYKVETMRLSLSGGDEFIKSMFDELVDGELSPGAIVEVVCRGIVKEHAPVFKKDGHEGKTVILLEVVRRITVLGHMTAKVDAAQNVDGEAKVLEEGEQANERPECFGVTGAAPVMVCADCDDEEACIEQADLNAEAGGEAADA